MTTSLAAQPLIVEGPDANTATITADSAEALHV